MAVEFTLFGGVEAVHEGRRLDLGPARQRCVLAVLLVEMGTAVSVDQLVERVWPGTPPARARVSVQSYVSRLRGVLTPADSSTRITRSSSGYQVDVPAEQVDLHRFRRLVEQARTAADDHAADLVERALRLGRGELFAGLDTPWLAKVRVEVEAERLAAVLDHADRLLRAGRHGPLVPVLAAETDQHPLHERLTAQLMLALYRDGRQAEALQRYRDIHARLAEELGVDPGPDLRELHQRILTADPALNRPVPPAAPVPRQLPPEPWLFAGRGEELAALSVRSATAPGPVVGTIRGPGGIGKTWLALRWAHHNAHRFPDGQLYVDLRGFDPTGTPTAPTDALRGFLAALGAETIPPDPDARTGLYRSLMADRRMLVLLDNAAGAAQVLPLLPGTPSCQVLITSRIGLTGLTVGYGALPVPLEPLNPAEAEELMAGAIGAERLAGEPAAAAELLGYCAGLPLALVVVAGRVRGQPGIALAALAAELRDTSTRLIGLGDDPDLNVRAVLSWSYRVLDPDAVVLSDLLATAPGAEFSRAAVIALTGWPAPRTASALAALVAASLLQRPAPDRYRMHDLVRLYATERAADLPSGLRDQALRRIIDHHANSACAADRALSPVRPAIDIPPAAPGSAPLDLSGDHAAALAWFDAEHANLLAAQRAAAGSGLPEAAWLLAWALTTYHHWRGLLTDDVTAWELGQRATETMDDPAPRIVAHRRLGFAYAWVDRHADALRQLEQGLELARRIGDQANQASTHHGISQALVRQGEHEQARRHAETAMRLFHDLQKRPQEANAMTAASWAAARVGDHEWAAATAEAALGLHRELGNTAGTADSVYTLAWIHQHSGHASKALRLYREALDLFRDTGNTHEEADTLYRLGQLSAASDASAARAHWTAALELYQQHRRTAEVTRTREALATLTG